MKKSLFVVIFLITLTCLSSCLPQDDSLAKLEEAKANQLLIKIAHDTADDSSLNANLLLMEQLLEEQSDGRIAVELYPYFHLGDTKDIVSLVSEGTIQIAIPLTSDPAALADQVDKNYPITVPDSWQIWDSLDGFYQYANKSEAIAAINGEVGAAMTATLADEPGQSLQNLGYLYDGPISLAAAEKIVKSPDDVRGKKIAVAGSEAWISAYESIYAYPLGVPLSEIYPALLKDNIDVYQTTPEYIATMFLDDYSSALTITEHGYAFRVILTNSDWYEDLSPEDAALLQSAIDILIIDQRQLATIKNIEAISTLDNRGMQIYFLSQEEKDSWQ